MAYPQRQLTTIPRVTALGLRALALAAMWATIATTGARGEDTVTSEADAYVIETLTIPDEAYLEVGALAWLPNDRLAVGTRRGEIWFVDHPAGEAPTWTRFAHGLHEVLGLAWKADASAGEGGGWLYVTHRPEVSRLADSDGDGTADRFETVADGWGVSGDYHEYAFGSKFDAKGDIWVVLCLTGSFSSEVPFRGWAVRVTPDGETIPAVSGIRSPGGIGFDSKGHLLYTDNQGPWNGTSMLKHLVEGDFMGHPGGFRWYDLAPHLEKPDEPKSGTRWATESRRIPKLRPPVVMFPHGIMGNSAAGIACDESGGAFGPFSGQVFVSDQSHSIVMRCFLEEIDGVMQGACFRFREGFKSGSLALQFAPDGSLYVGGTNRGWGSRGGGDYALERLHWSGHTPFEILAMRAVPGGFELEFTEPADLTTLSDPANYQMKSFTYIYQADYGSPVVDDETCNVLSATPSPDGRRVRLEIDNLRECVIHELTADGVRSASGQPLLHATGWYTLNRIP